MTFLLFFARSVYFYLLLFNPRLNLFPSFARVFPCVFTRLFFTAALSCIISLVYFSSSNLDSFLRKFYSIIFTSRDIL